MKKLFITTLAMLLPWVGMMAQTTEMHWQVDENQWPGETVVYAGLKSEFDPNKTDFQDYEVAAFVNGELRATTMVSTVPYAPSAIYNYVELRVKGDESDNGTITFKAYGHSSGIEYDLGCSPSISYDGETHGEPSNLVQLTMAEIESISLPEQITIGKGETIDLLPLITVYPEGATLSDANELVWEYANSYEFISVEDNKLTGLEVRDYNYLGLQVGTMSAYTWVEVTNYATALDIREGYEVITVNKGDNQTLTRMLNEAVVITPEDATDQVVWSIGDQNIVQPLDGAVGYNPVAAGTTTMTAQIMNDDGRPRLQATLTVNVVVPVESISFDFNDLALDAGELNSNVGDDLTAILTSHVKVLPEDATNKNFTFEVLRGEFIQVEQDGTVRAVASGYSLIAVVSDDNPQIADTYYIMVHNPAKDIAIGQEAIYVTYLGYDIDISQEVKGNISILPADYDGVTGFIIDDKGWDDIVELSGTNIEGGEWNPATGATWNVTAIVKKAGTATITVGLNYRDWLTYYNTGGNEGTVYVQKTFNVVASEGLSGFSINADNLVFGEQSTLILTPEPEGVAFDASKIMVTLSNNVAPQDWIQQLSNVTVQDGSAVLTVKPLLPGLNNINVFYDGEPISDGKVGIPARLNLASGWQWITLYYGDITPANLTTAFGGDNLVEIRSQNDLLYNDPVYGYFGALADNGLQQAGCYKIKMNNAYNSYLLYGGSVMTEEANLLLNKGWTWIPNIYLYQCPVNRLSYNGSSSDGDRIVSKDSGFAEYNSQTGEWVGTLTTLERGQGYLYYTTQTGKVLRLSSEFMWPAPSQAQGEEGGAKPFDAQTSPWQYDASRFSDNMSIIALAENVSDLDSYSVGAFVDGECRGEGSLVAGKLFITVHGKSGESIEFRFYDPFTGEQFDAKERVEFSKMLGTLKRPATLTKIGTATGISDIRQNVEEGSTVYDLNGRRVDSQTMTRGINIVRSADGKVQKMVRK